MIEINIVVSSQEVFKFYIQMLNPDKPAHDLERTKQDRFYCYHNDHEGKEE